MQVVEGLDERMVLRQLTVGVDLDVETGGRQRRARDDDQHQPASADDPTGVPAITLDMSALPLHGRDTNSRR